MCSDAVSQDSHPTGHSRSNRGVSSLVCRFHLKGVKSSTLKTDEHWHFDKSASFGCQLVHPVHLPLSENRRLLGDLPRRHSAMLPDAERVPINGSSSTSQIVFRAGVSPVWKYWRTYFAVQREGAAIEQCWGFISFGGENATDLEDSHQQHFVPRPQRQETRRRFSWR